MSGRELLEYYVFIHWDYPNSASTIQYSALAVLAVRQENINCGPAPSTSYSERESGQTTLHSRGRSLNLQQSGRTAYHLAIEVAIVSETGLGVGEGGGWGSW